MKKIIATVLCLTSSFALAGSLERSDFIGVWVGKGNAKKDIIVINEDFSGSYSRIVKRSSDDKFSFSSENVTLVDDVIIIEMYVDGINMPVRKLVLSGWEIDSGKSIYGMLLLYSPGVGQINGIPYSFESKNH